jgi:hypothetical protein
LLILLILLARPQEPIVVTPSSGFLATPGAAAALLALEPGTVVLRLRGGGAIPAAGGFETAVHPPGEKRAARSDRVSAGCDCK